MAADLKDEQKLTSFVGNALVHAKTETEKKHINITSIFFIIVFPY
jgi:hypothetical protein